MRRKNCKITISRVPGASSNKRGYVVLFSVILLAVVGLAIATSLIVLGLASSQSNFEGQESAQANSLAQACQETALDNLRIDPSYPGGETITLTDGSCQILPVLFSDPNYTVQAQASVGSVTRKISVQAQIQSGPPIGVKIIEWQEVADF